jgi:hypothetical protein
LHIAASANSAFPRNNNQQQKIRKHGIRAYHFNYASDSENDGGSKCCFYGRHDDVVVNLRWNNTRKNEKLKLKPNAEAGYGRNM